MVEMIVFIPGWGFQRKKININWLSSIIEIDMMLGTSTSDYVRLRVFMVLMRLLLLVMLMMRNQAPLISPTELYSLSRLVSEDLDVIKPFEIEWLPSGNHDLHNLHHSLLAIRVENT